MEKVVLNSVRRVICEVQNDLVPAHRPPTPQRVGHLFFALITRDWPRTDVRALPRSLPVLQDTNADGTADQRVIVQIDHQDTDQDGELDVGEEILFGVREAMVIGCGTLLITEKEKIAAVEAVAKRL